jgi:hypothetical protein
MLRKTDIDKNRGGIFARVVACTAGALVLSLSLAVGPACSKTVYDYVYSGTYIDGSGSTKGTFNSSVGDVAYDRDSEKVLVSVGGNPGYIVKFTKAGLPDPFSAPGMTDTITVPAELGLTTLALDESSAPSHGDIYLANRFPGAGEDSIYKFHPDGAEIAGWDDKIDSFTINAICALDVDPAGIPWLAGAPGSGAFLLKIRPDGTEYNENGNIGEEVPPYPYFPKGGEKHAFNACGVVFDTEGSAYAFRNNFGEFGTGINGKPIKFNATTGEEEYELSQVTTQDFAIDPSNNDVFVLQGDTVRQFDKHGAFLGEFGAPDAGHSFLGLENPLGIAVDPVTHDLWIGNGRSYGGVRHVERFERSPTSVTVPGTTTVEPDYAGVTAKMRGTLNPDGVETDDCHFEWGTTQTFGTDLPCAEGLNHNGTSDIPVTADIAGLVKGQAYYYRLSAKNGNGRISVSGTRRIIAQDKPKLELLFADQINTDGARLGVHIDPEGGDTSYHFEWGEVGKGFEESSPETETKSLLKPESVDDLITDLKPGTSYEFRAVVTNQAAVVNSNTLEFKTYLADPGVDQCPNALVRRQTGSALLDDCRAYELVSAADTGGFDVESDVVPGQVPLTAYPRANDRLLYSLHFGVVPGLAGSPTNLGLDPYVASRGPHGWTTRYVGLPADGMEDPGAFGSPLLGADVGLNMFAFGGDQICEPCFADGSTNVPVRLAGGELVKGMAGSQNPPANPTQEVAKPFSANGSHFIFGSDEKFETAGAVSGSIYDRNLDDGTTQVVSTTPAGVAIAGGEVAELDLSADGSKIVVGKRISTDSSGNDYWHLYMHVGTAAASVDLTPGTTTGVLFDGVSADGSRVFMTTKDKLLVGDTDVSADIYEAAVTGSSVALRMVSNEAGAPSNDDTCSPPELPDTWNAASGDGKCGAVAIAGGGGVAAGDGTFYFLSPEQLDGSQGIQNQPNLYVVLPGGDPRFVGTIDSSLGATAIDNPAIVHGVQQSGTHSYGDFQVSPDGRFAAFNSDVPLTGFLTLGHGEIYRYDSVTDTLRCPSCAPSGAVPSTDTSLPLHGLALADDGRVFFTSRESYALRDTNDKADAYEWNNGTSQLISTGIGPHDSGLVTVSADGTNAFFFTRDTLVPGDANGSAVKIYVARAGGGFLFDPPSQPCAASDECHGAGTQQVPVPNINTVTGDGLSDVVVRGKKCRRGFVRRKGKCVKRPSRNRHQKRHSSHTHG